MATEPDPPATAFGTTPKLTGSPGVQELLAALERRAQPPAAPAREVVVIVHGTYANPGYPSHPAATHWWVPRGSFGQALDAALQAQGSAARCELPFRSSVAMMLDLDRPRWHGWSGANSEVERRRGAFDLAAYLRSLQGDDTVGTIHLVAHSHGGNVVRRALRYLKRPTHKLGRVVCLGTPFLHFNDTAAWRRGLARVHWPMLWVLVAVLAGPFWLDKPPDELMYLVVGVAGAAAVSMWRFARRTEASAVDVPITALRFEHDEAIGLLRACAALCAEPHLAMRDVLRAVEAPPRVPAWASSASEVWNGPLCHAAERLTSLAYRMPLLGALLGHLCTLFLLLPLFQPYRPPLRPFFASRLPRLRELFFHSIDETMARDRAPAPAPPQPHFLLGLHEDSYKPPTTRAERWLGTARSAWKGSAFHPDSLQAVAAVGPVALYALLVYPLDLLVGLPAWCGAVLTRFFILLGARAAAGGASGVDSLGAAFDPRATGTPPPRATELTIPRSIETEIEQRLDAAMRLDLAPLRAALDPARRAMLVDAAQRVFSDPALLHAQYYQEPRVVEVVARLIAGTPTPDWPEPPAAPGV